MTGYTGRARESVTSSAEDRALRAMFAAPAADGHHSRCCAKCSRGPYNTVDCGYNWTGCPNGCHR